MSEKLARFSCSSWLDSGKQWAPKEEEPAKEQKILQSQRILRREFIMSALSKGTPKRPNESRPPLG